MTTLHFLAQKPVKGVSSHDAVDVVVAQLATEHGSFMFIAAKVGHCRPVVTWPPPNYNLSRLYSPSSSDNTQCDTESNAQIGPHERTRRGQKLANIEGLALSLENKVFVSMECRVVGSRKMLLTACNHKPKQGQSRSENFGRHFECSMSSVVGGVTCCPDGIAVRVGFWESLFPFFRAGKL